MAEKIPARRPRRDSTSGGAERSIAEAQRFGLTQPELLDEEVVLDALEPRERDYRANIAAANRSTGREPFRVGPFGGGK